MEIVFENCNNINTGSILINENCLNIKYAINGTGKSTIAQAISLSISDDNSNLGDLTPFRYMNSQEKKPKISGHDSIRSIKVFDENYINTFVFKPDELINGSFDIFIRNEEYINGLEKINDLVKEINQMFSQNRDIDDLISDFSELINSFGRPTRSGIHGSSILARSFKNGNKIQNIPENLNPYKEFIQYQENYKWIKWQIDGQTYLDIADKCPYCTESTSTKKELIKRVSQEYNPREIENLNKIVLTFQRLNKYFSEETIKEINDFITNIHGYSDDQIAYLLEVKDQIERLLKKFYEAKSIGFDSLKDVDQLIENLNKRMIKLELFTHLNSEGTQEKVNIINDSIQLILTKAAELQAKIDRQKKIINKLIEENSKDINCFLKNAGYQYTVKLVENENNEIKLKLIHNDIPDEIPDAKQHLSFGERNAISLILFMYDSIKQNPDLIILDDPISSFDKNKKYATIEMMFRKEKFFRNKTVLLLTHDLDPIIDMIFHHTDRFAKPFVTFLENDHGKLIEKCISKSDIKTFVEINTENISTPTKDILHKLVYLRRLYELNNHKDAGYHLVSNIFHKRTPPTLTDPLTSQERNMTPEEIGNAINEIQQKIPEFSYNDCMQEVLSDERLKVLYNGTQSNYEKLHIFRTIYIDKKEQIESSVLLKFVNEAFHIENGHIYQIDPCKYQLIPFFVIDLCDEFLN